MSRPPIIILGMHRSGSALVSRVLEQLGAFLGWQKPYENESIFFTRLNSCLLRECGATWAYPQPVRRLLDNKEVRASAEEYLRFVISTPRIVSYLGVGRYLRYRSVFSLSFPWGWKDPRNTFTLPLWLDLFPDAKVIHVFRNGVDVACSLIPHTAKVLEKHRNHLATRKLAVLLQRDGWRGSEFLWAIRCSSLDGGFSLWEEYLQEARSHVGRLGNRAMEVRFEDFLADPREGISSLAEFCDLSVQKGVCADIIDELRSDRAYAYRRDKELRSFADRVSSRLNKYGY